MSETATTDDTRGPERRGPERRGQAARSPAAMTWRGYLEAGRRVFARLGPDRVGLVAAGIAFFGLLALFPGIAALFAIAGLVIEPDTVAAQLEASVTALPASARSILIGQVNSVAGAEESGLSLAALGALGLAVFSASRGIANLVAGLNLVYGETEERGILHLTALHVALTVFMMIALTLALIVVAVIPVALSLLGNAEGLQNLSELLRWPVLIAIAAATFTVLYRYGPSRRNARWRWLAPGGVVACLLWVGLTAAFGWYVETLGSYNETFGALGGVIVLLLWLWISSFVVLLGGLMDAELEAQTGIDSTVGPDLPRGERGAVKADACAPCDDDPAP
ncbi:YihY/virulence factor BrkB family protein [Roseibacterium sp. SDUM158017]|uniref:YihY/virulence factor BrkB family protein n=1 Tax=Roseicyclus salinarum TaxID=3036773 RepID=UPI0024157CFC|nr:YihY/virulence factor BrkB family protein [Roseibacterium sp. SDUM158017]MDG4647808.1 YihY/virulence factor BrkB family protein [Roseibacterium sp. SDUM158017]